MGGHIFVFEARAKFKMEAIIGDFFKQVSVQFPGVKVQTVKLFLEGE